MPPGRKKVDHYMDDFLIPKKLTCTSCNNPRGNPPEQFKIRVNKLDMSPEEFVSTFVCRVCKKAEREGLTIDKSEVSDESEILEPDNSPKPYVADTRNLTSRVGFLVHGQHPVILATNMGSIGFPLVASKLSTDVLQLAPKRLQLKYVHDGIDDKETNEDRIKELTELFRTAIVYDYDNLLKFIREKAQEEKEDGSLQTA